jgi:hypothetical protein
MQTIATNGKTGRNGTTGSTGPGVPPVSRRTIRPCEAAGILHVDTNTLLSYVRAGRLHRTRTIGGHSRYWEEEVRTLAGALAEEAEAADEPAVCPMCGHTCTPPAERPAPAAAQSAVVAA